MIGTEPCGCDCDAVHEALCELVDGTPSPEQKEELRRLLAACPACYQRLQSEETIRMIIRRCAEVEHAPDGLRTRITSQLRVTAIGRDT